MQVRLSCYILPDLRSKVVDGKRRATFLPRLTFGGNDSFKYTCFILSIIFPPPPEEYSPL